MLMYGTAKVADMIIKVKSDTVYFNISSLAERWSSVRLQLIPPNSLGANSEYDYDVKYMQWIFGNDPIFLQFMNIMNALYNGYDVFLIVTDENWSDITVESLLKLIQQRYGINAILINTIEDLQCAEDSIFEPYGIVNLDQDLERYQYIVALMGGIKSGEG